MFAYVYVYVKMCVRVCQRMWIGVMHVFMSLCVCFRICVCVHESCMCIFMCICVILCVFMVVAFEFKHPMRFSDAGSHKLMRHWFPTVNSVTAYVLSHCRR